VVPSLLNMLSTALPPACIASRISEQSSCSPTGVQHTAAALCHHKYRCSNQLYNTHIEVHSSCSVTEAPEAVGAPLTTLPKCSFQFLFPLPLPEHESQ
jgi:hypothetical protein